MTGVLTTRWAAFAKRFDALGERERMLAFGGGVLLGALFLGATLLFPVLDGLRGAQREIAQLRRDAMTHEAQARALQQARGVDPDAAVRARIVQLRGQLADLQSRLEAHSGQLVAPSRMAGMLREVLLRNRGLALVEIRSVAPVGAETPSAPSAQQGNNQTVGAERQTVYRHGLVLTVRGTYLDQLRYLRELERMPYRMFWQNVEITTEQYPEATMRITVHTLSPERSYLAL